ncbi:MAG: Uma2 family endonuclease [Thermomicrobiales bacterium]
MARQVIEPAAKTERTFRMSYEDYFAWAGEDTFSEWVDGEVTVFVPPDERHNNTNYFLTVLLGLFVGLFDLGKVLTAPFEMKLREGRSYREPDLLFVAREHFDRLDGQRLNGPADLVLEIMSDDSVTRDRRDKFAEYAAAGVPEYWLLDPRTGRQSFWPYGITAEGYYEELPLDDVGLFHSAVLAGFWLDPNWLWQDPLPNPDAILMEIAPDAYLDRIKAFHAARRSSPAE